MRAKRPRIFYGWWVVATAALGLLLGASPIVVLSFGVFLKSLTGEFHAGRGAISLAFTLHNLTSAALAPLIGRLADRYGARRVILPGIATLALTLISARALGSSLWQLYLFYIVLGTVSMATTPIPYTTVVSHWFDRRRGTALGLMMLGIGVGAIVMPPTAERLIAAFGWRSAFALVGCVILIVPMPIVGAFLKEDPRQKGLLPDGETEDRSVARAAAPLEGLGWRDIWHEPVFWLMVVAFVLVGASVHACVLHMAALLADRGMSTREAALGSSVVGLAMLAGRTGTGLLLDRFFAPRVALVIFCQSAAGMALLWTGAAGPVALIAAFMVGLGMGAEVDIIAYLMSRYFGLRALGTAFGYGFGSFVLAGAFGVFVMGAGFDRQGSYRVPLAGFCVATLAAAALMTRLGPYRFRARGVPPGVAPPLQASVEPTA